MLRTADRESRSASDIAAEARAALREDGYDSLAIHLAAMTDLDDLDDSSLIVH